MTPTPPLTITATFTTLLLSIILQPAQAFTIHQYRTNQIRLNSSSLNGKLTRRCSRRYQQIQDENENEETAITRVSLRDVINNTYENKTLDLRYNDGEDLFGPLLPVAERIDAATKGWGLSYANCKFIRNII